MQVELNNNYNTNCKFGFETNQILNCMIVATRHNVRKKLTKL